MNNAQLIKKIATEYNTALGEKRGWLDVHLNQIRPTNFGMDILFALALCEKKQEGLGIRFAKELAEVPYVPSNIDRDRWISHFEQLIQKFSELIALKAICSIDWEDPFHIKIEPKNKFTGKRPDFVVREKGHDWVFEVKCPTFVSFQEKRKKNSFQLPVRSFLHGQFKDDLGGLTLPRDNVVKDFLVSAENKFLSFGESQTGILLIIWNNHIYEAISVLKHPQAGMLTAQSWLKEGLETVQFGSVDHVLILNKLDDLVGAAQMSPYAQGIDPFALDRQNGLPAAWCPNDEKQVLDARITNAFDAWSYDATQFAADYALTDFVMWVKPGDVQRRMRSIRRRTPYMVTSSRDAIIMASR